MITDKTKPTRCPYCGSDILKHEHENEWGDESGHRPLIKHTCNDCNHKFYTE